MNTGNGRLALILFIFVLFIVFTSPIYAASENSAQNITVSPTMVVRMYDSVTPAPNNTSPAVDYTLPYPGLLPDSPLYFLKTFRDRLISFFISSPIKKADFDLLQSDKRINAALYLAANKDGSKQSLAITTISKAENYLEEGIGQIKQGKSQGEVITDTVGSYKQATLKYLEVLKILETKSSGDFKKQLQANESRIKNLQKQISSLPTK